MPGVFKAVRMAMFLLCMAATMNVFAQRQLNIRGCEAFEFSQNSAKLSDEAKVKLVNSMRNIQSLRLGALVFIGWGDIPSKQDHSDQKLLAEQRAKTLRDFYLVEAGIHEKYTYWEGRMNMHANTRSNAIVEYIGVCLPGHHQIICEQFEDRCMHMRDATGSFR